MKESYSEGIAHHTGPESCAGTREGAGEALTGVCAGPGMEPRNGNNNRGCGRTWTGTERNIRSAVELQSHSAAEREAGLDPAWSKTPSTYRNSSHGNRESLRLTWAGEMAPGPQRQTERE